MKDETKKNLKAELEAVVLDDCELKNVTGGRLLKIDDCEQIKNDDCEQTPGRNSVIINNMESCKSHSGITCLPDGTVIQ